MTLFAPFSALAAAALCVPALVLLYMLKLRRRPVRVGSTMLWRSAVDDLQANVPLRWLRASWLLFLHLLILGLLITAIGRPVLSSAGDARARVVILLDRSASMRATDGPNGSERWREAQERSIEMIDRALSVNGTSVALVAFAAEARVLVGLTSEARTLRDAVRELTPTDQPADLAAGLRAVESLILRGESVTSEADTADPERPKPAEVVLITDGSMEPARDLSLAGGSLKLELIGPASRQATPRAPSSQKARTEARTSGDAGPTNPDATMVGPDNLGIVSFAARRDYEDPSLTRVLVGVANASEAERDVAVVLSINGRTQERRALHVPAHTSRTNTAPASITFEVHAPEGGLVTARLDRTDVLAADDSASLVLPAVDRPRILLVQPDAANAGTPAVSPPWLLADALTELRASLRTVSASLYESMAAGGTIDADLVVFDRVTPRSTPPVPTLSFGAGLPLAGLRVSNGSTRANGTGTYFVAWSRAHPVLRDVALGSVYVAGEPAIEWADQRADGSGTRFMSLADGAVGSLIGLIEDGPRRRLIVGFDAAESNWPLQPGFPIFLSSAVDYLTLRGEQSAGRAFTTAQRVEVHAAPGASRIELRGPEVLTAAPVEHGRGFEGQPEAVGFGLIERVGVYQVEPPGADVMVALNLLNPIETGLAGVSELRVSGRTVESGGGARLPREIWHWFVLAGGALLLVEWVLYAARMRTGAVPRISGMRS